MQKINKITIFQDIHYFIDGSAAANGSYHIIELGRSNEQKMLVKYRLESTGK